jgi:hypothetical protein
VVAVGIGRSADDRHVAVEGVRAGEELEVVGRAVEVAVGASVDRRDRAQAHEHELERIRHAVAIVVVLPVGER